ncbi:MAG TPA: hypothetical protein VJT82_11945, partial [Pyrinomonadaceae bacterium]|nr:hypothetical protein [Pyrinomonadaceae bacterium]
MPTSTGQERKTSKASPDGATEAKAANAAATTSTLIEFPGVPPKPQWRKELSERVREIQQRRALEAAREAEEYASQNGYTQTSATSNASAETSAASTDETHAPQLGLVPPPPEAAQPNPLVVAALKRIERARKSTPPPMPRASRGG